MGHAIFKEWTYERSRIRHGSRYIHSEFGIMIAQGNVEEQ
jgi:hypothetical protein